ncbi:Bug family tripartite tricarboxylate transporter substrate binding protein [Comamonas endophytica]|uniref:Tripartite tricarboxylate transporter substrate binding protein n=1 Tax=Comamonas endophytica TaxID=2949090 RepID=A0ABY6GFN1_9BURK|nr:MULTISPECIES: tripartite tricarboxylate transporter substrate binding protein [unclassified Acidovorax]MCD2513160.1 tripartite tricarboxylate transporter substrate binding protein [Acidovorax sp. D4N7]UYG53490.1 tripartite tricarboxylate transporter substrate binding protein [Acidovorax sp. 5MLIR]
MKTLRTVLRQTAIAVVAGLTLFTGTVAQAQGAYPSAPVRVVVGFAPGGPIDLVARLMAKHLAGDLGQPFVVENKVGAAGNIATNEAGRAKPDGATLLAAGINMTLNPLMTDDLKVDSVKDFRAVRMVAAMPTILVVGNSFPARNFAEFLDELRKHPNRYSSAAPGSTPLLATELFSNQTGTQITPVPYKGAAPAMVDLIAGHVDLSFASLGSVMPHIKAGKLRALAIASPARHGELRDVPTFAELGMKDFSLDSWVGMLVPAKTPDAVVERLAASLDGLAKSPGFAAQLASAGMAPVPTNSPEQFAKTIATELASYEPLVKRVREKSAR